MDFFGEIFLRFRQFFIILHIITEKSMYRTNTCGELRISDAGREVTLAGWVQRARKMGGMTFVDIRDRYGITQVVLRATLTLRSARPPTNSAASG